MYTEREKEQRKKIDTEQIMRESQSNIEKKEPQLRKNEEWNAREKRENMGFTLFR